MKHSISVFLFAISLAHFATAQSASSKPAAQQDRYVSSPDNDLIREEAEVQGFAQNLSLLKEAFAAKDMGKIAMYESAVLMAMRAEMSQARSATTASAAANLQAMEHTLTAFSGHSFDPSKPEDAARDFAKLDKILVLMQESLAEMKSARK